jgi:hypothetical protein
MEDLPTAELVPVAGQVLPVAAAVGMRVVGEVEVLVLRQAAVAAPMVLQF